MNANGESHVEENKCYKQALRARWSFYQGWRGAGECEGKTSNRLTKTNRSFRYNRKPINLTCLLLKPPSNCHLYRAVRVTAVEI